MLNLKTNSFIRLFLLLFSVTVLYEVYNLMRESDFPILITNLAYIYIAYFLLSNICNEFVASIKKIKNALNTSQRINSLENKIKAEYILLGFLFPYIFLFFAVFLKNKKSKISEAILIGLLLHSFIFLTLLAHTFLWLYFI